MYKEDMVHKKYLFLYIHIDDNHANCQSLLHYRQYMLLFSFTEAKGQTDLTSSSVCFLFQFQLKLFSRLDCYSFIFSLRNVLFVGSFNVVEFMAGHQLKLYAIIYCLDAPNFTSGTQQWHILNSLKRGTLISVQRALHSARKIVIKND